MVELRRREEEAVLFLTWVPVLCVRKKMYKICKIMRSLKNRDKSIQTFCENDSKEAQTEGGSLRWGEGRINNVAKGCLLIFPKASLFGWINRDQNVKEGKGMLPKGTLGLAENEII
jgi:hypothetical protein